MSDRLAEIKRMMQGWDAHLPLDDQRWLVAEVERLREGFRAVIDNDKTPAYTYRGKDALRRDGLRPEQPYTRWNTPAETARMMLREDEA